MNIVKTLVLATTILMLIGFVAVRLPATVQATDIDKTDPASLGTLTIGNTILDAHIQDVPGTTGIGTYTIETGSSHPNPGENVFYGGAAEGPWSSYNTIHVTDTMRDYVTTASSPSPDPGYTLVNLDSLSPTVSTPDSATIMTNWTTPENLRIVQVNEVLGTAESDTRVRTTMWITNNDNIAHQVGVRYEWDLMINGWDGAWIRPWTDATTPGGWLNTETEWVSPTFQFWETSNMPASLFSVYGGLSQPPGATTPDRVVYAHWSSSHSRAYTYTPTGMIIGATFPTVGGQYDSAVLYYWNPTTINPGETRTTTAYITTFLLQQVPPIGDLPEENVWNLIWSADLDGNLIPDSFWFSGYDISFADQTLRIEINIQLVGDNPGDLLRQQWHDGIEDIWSNSYDIVDGLYTYPIEIAVNWVSANPHHTVHVHDMLATYPDHWVNMLNWYTQIPHGAQYQDEVAAHEAGHMLGLYDEYPDGALDPDTQFTTTNSIMADLGPTRSWHYEQILEWLETRSGRDLSLAQSPLPPYPLDDPIPDFTDPMDSVPPTTNLTIGEPKYVSDEIYVTPDTPFTLEATDTGSGVYSTAYRIYNATYDSGWQTYTTPFELASLADGTYTIEYNSTDNVGNVEPTNMTTVVLDNTAPDIIVANPPAGWALQDGVAFLGSITDAGCGVFSMSFSIREADGGEGVPIGFEDLPVEYDPITGAWSFFFDTLLVPDGYYVLHIEVEDNLGNEASTTIPYSIRNWAVIELLPSSEDNKARRSMPVKFALRVAAEVDPNQPFVYNEELRIEICATSNPSEILQESYFGDTSRDYRISSVLYITNFRTLKTPMEYTVAIYRDSFDVGSFTFETIK